MPVRKLVEAIKRLAMNPMKKSSSENDVLKIAATNTIEIVATLNPDALILPVTDAGCNMIPLNSLFVQVSAKRGAASAKLNKNATRLVFAFDFFKPT